MKMQFQFANNNASDRFAGRAFDVVNVVFDPDVNDWVPSDAPDAVAGVFDPDWGFGPIGQPFDRFGQFI
jgi:hypothetical protein